MWIKININYHTINSVSYNNGFFYVFKVNLNSPSLFSVLLFNYFNYYSADAFLDYTLFTPYFSKYLSYVVYPFIKL